MKIKAVYFALFVLFACACQQEQASENQVATPGMPVAAPDNGGITLPENFGAVVVADSAGRARHLAISQNGNIYIKLRRLNSNGNGIVMLQDTTGDGQQDIVQAFGDFGGTGIAFHNNYLYASSDTEVFRYPLDENGEVAPGTRPDTVVTGFLPQSDHEVKPFTFDSEGHIYVNVGAPSNACQEKPRTPGSAGLDPCPQLQLQAGIWQFSADSLHQGHATHGYRYATGIRNAVALDWNTSTNSLYAVQHGRDQLNTLWPEYFNEEANAELPAEEFLKVSKDADFGWPYCYYDPAQNKKLLAPEYGGDGQQTGRCEDVEQPLMSFPAHWAPNDLLFYTGNLFPERYKNGAFIAFHGSWNRAPKPQQGYKVVFVPFENGKPTGEYEVFADGFAGQDTITTPGKAEFRPMGLAQGPDGSLYISDSVKGKIWRVLYYGKEVALR